jgi:hypothetical protein
VVKLRRLHLSLRPEPALSASRISLGKEKLVYVLITNKKIHYEVGKSRIAYIGTTKKGVSRIAQSVAVRAYDILSIRGVTKFDARVVTCRPRKNVSTWKKLERAMLLEFKEMYGEVPYCNTHGKRMKEIDEFRYFARQAVRSVLEELS